jgi:hypothetical protein
VELYLYASIPPSLLPREGLEYLLEGEFPNCLEFLGKFSFVCGDFEHQISSRDQPSSLNTCYNYYVVPYHKTILKELVVEEHWEAVEAVATPLFKRLSNTKIHKVTKDIDTTYKN